MKPSIGYVLAVCLTFIIAVPAPAMAFRIVVNVTNDAAVGGSDCGFRDSFRTSNGNSPIDGCILDPQTGINTIVLGQGSFVLSQANASGTTDQSENNALTGDIDIRRSVVVEGSGESTTIIDGNSISRVFQIVALGGNMDVTFRDLTIRNGRPNSTCGSGTQGGGGIEANSGGILTLERVTIEDSCGTAGGGIHPFSSLVLTTNVTDSTFQRNSASVIGGAVSSHNTTTFTRVLFMNNTSGPGVNGSAIGIPNGVTTVVDSLFVGNTSGGYGTITVQGFNNNSAGRLITRNVTISGNRTNGGGGGIYVHGGVGNSGNYGCITRCQVEMFNTTITNNIADYVGSGWPIDDGGGIRVNGNGGTSNAPGLATVRNSIVAGNTDASGNTAPDISGTVVSGGNNLIGSLAGATFNALASDIVNVNAMLAPLADNGGPMLTHALLAGSPAIDAGATDPLIPTDQRGISRPQGSASDIGAFELEAAQSEPVCGNGVVETGEQCDDGNTLYGDCCDGMCQLEPAGSLCDDSNACTVTDACNGSSVCTGSGSTCGNQIVDTACGEVCDDGNTASQDGCTGDCLHTEILECTWTQLP